MYKNDKKPVIRERPTIKRTNMQSKRIKKTGTTRQRNYYKRNKKRQKGATLQAADVEVNLQPSPAITPTCGKCRIEVNLYNRNALYVEDKPNIY